MDSRAFKEAGSLLTHYSVDLAMAEFCATKDIAANIEAGKMEPFEFYNGKKVNLAVLCQQGIAYLVSTGSTSFISMINLFQLVCFIPAGCSMGHL
jgi:hypothetical protein